MFAIKVDIILEHIKIFVVVWLIVLKTCSLCTATELEMCMKLKVSTEMELSHNYNKTHGDSEDDLLLEDTSHGAKSDREDNKTSQEKENKRFIKHLLHPSGTTHFLNQR
ncbi:hypothetical protein AVEN_244518-1 [Araneus ventricosus]|uniref:Uncharacterized protein n=1 Tax=Araneus ventricosus TaxID=182803 RepID=A0A4Y2F272_ARAVE|nr:hypothetical protein AVEN_244518-1 [Araneus ventricosus]